MSHMLHLGIRVAFIMLVFHQVGYASSTSYPITKIDRKGIVTVTDLKSKQTFQFQVRDPKVLRSLKVGQLVYPDFPNQKVSLDGRNLCCVMINLPPSISQIEGNTLPNSVEPIQLAPELKRPNPLRQPMPPPAPGAIPQR